MVRMAQAVREFTTTPTVAAGLPAATPAISPAPGQGLRFRDTLATPEKIYAELIECMRQVGEKVSLAGPLDLEGGSRCIGHILNVADQFREELHQLTLLSTNNHNDPLATHAVNVAINSIIIGAGFGCSRERLRLLGTAALFHEVGMYMVPAAIRGKPGKLSDEEWAEIRKHPETGFRILRQCGKRGEEIGEIIQQEHERADGSGYPRRLRNGEIHESAYIIGILDIYESLVHSRPYRKRMSPADAIKLIVERSKGLFPPPIVKGVLRQLSIYPVKSFVRLNNESVGMVIKANTLWPLKPVVRIIYDESGARLPDNRRITDLSKVPLLYVKDVITEDEILNI